MERARPSTVEAKTGNLPTDMPDNLVIISTLDRFSNPDGSPGFVPRCLASVNKALERDGMTKDTAILIGDATPVGKISNIVRANLLSEAFDDKDRSPKTYVFTTETRQAVADELHRRTKIDKNVINAVTTGVEYGQNRAHLDVLIGGMVMASESPKRALAIDDDVVIPERYVEVREHSIPELNGSKRTPNSQVIFKKENGDFPPEVYERKDNPGLRSFFEHLGEKVGDIRRSKPDFRATEKLHDTMHEQLEVSLVKGAAKFDVTVPKDRKQDIENADDAVIIGATGTKAGMPDYRTVQIARTALEDEFPKTELSRLSFPFGQKEIFAFRQCDTNVDSAVFSRLMNGESVFMPWWFVSDEKISARNPYGTVPGRYRADNELLPVLPRVIEEQTGKKYLYLGGVETQALHERATVGYRPDLATVQAPASLVGNVAALEAARRLEIDKDGMPHIRKIDDNYEAPDAHSKSVFNELVGLATICHSKMFTLDVKRRSVNDSSELQHIDDNIGRYKATFDSLKKQTADWEYGNWKKALDVEVRDQLRFFRQIVEATPVFIEESKKMIKEGKYPVVEMVDASAPKTIFEKPAKSSRALIPAFA